MEQCACVADSLCKPMPIGIAAFTGQNVHVLHVGLNYLIV